MSLACGLWSILLQPGEKSELFVIRDVRITSAALDAELKDENARTSIKLTYPTPIFDNGEDEEDGEDDDETPEQTTTVLCSLTPGKIEQATLDLILTVTDDVIFEVVGKNAIHLSGNYIDQSPPPPGYDSDDDEESDDEDGYDLREVSSDVEVDPAELDIMMDGDNEEDNSGRFEEIVDAPPAEVATSKKRPRESDAVEGEEEQKLSKKQLKKLKQQKTDKENGAVTKEDVKGEKAEASKDTDKAAKEAKKEKKKEKKEVKTAASAKTELPKGLIVEDKKVGTGKAAKEGDLVSMRYVGKFPDSKKVFDSNTKGKPFSFRLGAGEVIKGWDLGIAGMMVGGERLLIVPPNLGYGSRKIDGIPANSTLRFECKLLEIKP